MTAYTSSQPVFIDRYYKPGEVFETDATPCSDWVKVPAEAEKPVERIKRK